MTGKPSREEPNLYFLLLKKGRREHERKLQASREGGEKERKGQRTAVSMIAVRLTAN